MYDEYVSPEELSSMLFGPQRVVTSAQELRAERSFANQVFLSLLYNYYSYESTHERIHNNVAYKTMIMLGMSHYDIRPRMVADDGDRFEKLILLHPDYYPENRYLINDREDAHIIFVPEGTYEEYAYTTVDTEVDLGYRKGLVSRQELLQRLKVLMRYSREFVSYVRTDAAENDGNYDFLRLYVGTLLPDDDEQRRVMLIENPQYERQQNDKIIYWDLGLKHDQIPYEFEDFIPTENYAWLGAYFDELPGGVQRTTMADYVGVITEERRLEIILECLIQFPELVNNWPRNQDNPDLRLVPSNPRNDETPRVKSFRRNDPKFRSDSVIDDLFQDISREGRNLSIYHIPEYYTELYSGGLSTSGVDDWYELDQQDGVELIPNVPIVQGFDTGINNFKLSHEISVRRIVGREIERSSRTVSSPAFKSQLRALAPELTIQERVLDFYTSRVLRNFNSVPIREDFPGDLVQVAKYGILDTRILRGIEGEQKNEIIRLQQEILQHLNDNLKIGARFMFGFSARRREINSVLESIVESQLDIVDGQPTSSVHEITPESIFGDIVYDPNNFTFGLRSDRNIFTRKRAFLGFYDTEPILVNGRVNEESIFETRANSVYAAITLGENPDLVTETRYSELNSRLKDNVVYSIPLDEYITKVDCLMDLYMDARSDAGSQQIYNPNEQSNNLDRSLRDKFISSDMYENYYKDKILRNILSLDVPNEETGVRSVMDPNVSGRYVEEMKKEHRLMFDLLFPVDRYTALHMLQNVQYFDQNTDEDRPLFASTKLLILTLLNQVVNSTEYNNTIIEFSEAGGKTPGGIELKINNLIEMLVEFMYKMLPVAMRAAIRNIVGAVDPAYRDMRRGYLKDPCSMSAGLKPQLLGNGKMKTAGGTNWSEIKDGFAKVDGHCKKYISINKFPSDLSLAIFSGNAREAKKVADYAYNLITGKDERYGYPTNFITRWALEVGEIPMEDHKYLKKNNGCEDACEEKPNVQPAGECDDV